MTPQTQTQRAPAQAAAQNQTTSPDFQRLLEKPGERSVEYVPFGAADKIKLSVDIVQKILCSRTAKGETCTTRDAVKFIMMCQAKRLNPFEGDAFIIGYDSQKYGPQFSLVVAHQAFLKRAEVHSEYDGMESGIVVMGESGPFDIEGDFHLPDDKVIGGWARVHFKNRKFPIYRRLRLERFNKERSLWLDDAAGMICKCAEADALRSSFPTMLGGLYMKGEVQFDVSADDIRTSVVPQKRNGDASSLVATVQNFEPRSVDAVQNPEDDVPWGHAAGTPIDQPAPKAREPKPLAEAVQDQLAKVVTESGFTWDHLAKWGDTSGAIPDATKYGGFDDLPSEVCARLLRARTGLMRGLEAAKGGAQ